MWEIGIRAFVFVLSETRFRLALRKNPCTSLFVFRDGPLSKTTLWQQENFDLKLSGTPAPYGTVANVHHSRRITLRDWGWFLDRTRGWFGGD